MMKSPIELNSEIFCHVQFTYNNNISKSIYIILQIEKTNQFDLDHFSNKFIIISWIKMNIARQIIGGDWLIIDGQNQLDLNF